MIYRFDHWQLDSSARELAMDGARISTPRRVFDLLLYLLEHRERAVGRDELVAAVWGRVDVADVQVSQLVARARKLIGDDANTQSVIRTISGYGYRWVLPVQAQDAPPSAAVQPATQPASAIVSVPVQLPFVEDDSTALRTPTPQSAQPPLRSPPSSVRRWLALAALLLSVLAALLAWTRWNAPATPPPPIADAAFVVLPMQVDGATDDDWIRLGAMDLVASRLRRAGVRVVSSENVLAGLHAVSRQRGGNADAGLAGILGTAQFVRGTVARVGKQWRITLQTAGPATRTLRVWQEDADAMRGASRATDLLLQSLGRAPTASQGAVEQLAEQVQRIRASILSGDLAAARQALIQLPERLRAHARIRLLEAELDYHSGQLDVAAGKLGALLDDPELSASERARVLLARGMLAMRVGDCGDAEQRFAQVLDAAGSGGDAALLAANALAGRGLARSCLGQDAAAADDLGLARVRMEALADPLGVARVENYRGLLELERGAPQRAVVHLQSALQRFDALAVIDAQRAVLSGLLDAHVQLLDWTAATTEADRLLALRAQVSDPLQRQLLDSDRARVLIGSGQLEAAQVLLDAAESEQPARGPALRLLDASRAELAWRRGDAALAHSTASRVLQQWPAGERGDRYWRLRLLTQQAAAALALPATAVEQALAAAGVTPALQDRSLPLMLLLIANQSAAEQATAAAAQYQQALQAADRQGVPATLVAVSTAAAGWQLRQGQAEAAATLVGRTASWAETDFDAALLRLALFHAQGEPTAWSRSLIAAQALAGERPIPAYLLQEPSTTVLGSDPLAR